MSETWLRRHSGDAHAFATDVTSGYAQINVQGPRSRELLASPSPTRTCPNEAFPFRAAPRSTSASRGCCACASPTWANSGMSCTFPAEQAVHVYDRLAEAGRGGRLRHAGSEGARRACGWRRATATTGTTSTTPTRCWRPGSGFAVALDKPDGFIGRDAVLAQKERGPLRRRLVSNDFYIVVIVVYWRI